MRRTFTFALLFTIAATFGACGGSSNTSGNSGRSEMEESVNSERVESSNIAPTGGPGAEPESRGAQSAGNTNESKAENKNKADNKNTQ